MNPPGACPSPRGSHSPLTVEAEPSASFTPGPWVVIPKRSRRVTGNLWAIVDGECYPAAFVPGWDDPGPGEADGSVEAEANARLIAAAPEMYEALKELHDENGNAIRGMALAAAALAKAEGR